MAQTQSQSSLPFEATPRIGAGAAGAHTLLSRALPAEPGVWDELRQPDGHLRPAWEKFAQTLGALGALDALSAREAAAEGAGGLGEELDRRVVQVAQRIRQDGVTHNVFSDDPAVASAARPWSLELLPQLIEASEWAGIEAGVAQRAELQQRVLADLYATGPGSQRLLHEGLLPPALLLRHPGWLRPMVGFKPPSFPDGVQGETGGDSADEDGLRLFIVAFDLARGPDGRWWQVAQRTQGPSGLGYVMHNRMVVARQFPDAFREMRVQRIASSYRRLLDTVERAAKAVAARLGDGAPRVVLLTPGPYSETYFEHAYLARYLGVPLVEGGDLTVRGDRLFLKTMEGLAPVHGLLRRLDDDWCDPLELRSDSTLGVPGLLSAARAGAVVMANALGSAFLESPAIQGFMPGIARRLMGQPLLLPSLPTWWCGEGAAWADVREHLDDKLVRSTFPRGGRTSQLRDPGAMAVDEDPEAWTVQGRLRFSRAPIWGDGAVAPRPAMVRVYAIAEGGGRWHVLPGGMTRVARREDGSVSMQRGGTSLDTWVLTDGPVDTFSMLPRRLEVDDILQRHRPVSSRTGENLFWLGRYTERTEQLLRLARATLATLSMPGIADAAGPAEQALMSALSTLAVKTGLAPHGVPTLAQSAHLFERALLAGLGDREGSEGTASIAYNLAALERSATALRERLSPEHWGLICAMREDFARDLEASARELQPHTVQRAQVMAALDRLGLQLAGVTGAQTDRMTRDHGWRLLAVGRLLERLIGVTLRLRVFIESRALGSGFGSVESIELLLELFDSLITFRARYQRHEDLLAVADLLVLDSANPRAFAGVLRRLRTEIVKLPGEPEVQQALLALLPAEGIGLTLESLRGADDAAIARALRAVATCLGQTASVMADRVSERFFTLAQGVDQSV